jgi:hypothetical protein
LNPKTEEHKRKISESMMGKKASIEKIRKLSAAFSNGNHPRCLLWTIQNPEGLIFITKDLKSLCKRFDLSYSSFRYYHQHKITTPIWGGKSKGWAVLKTEVTPKLTLEPFEVIDFV